MKKARYISVKKRFEVFKRDSFTCQYCGLAAPEVILHIDHIEPVSKGGSNDILNLITSCKGCNLGKGARRLSDNSVVVQEAKILADQADRISQMKLLVKWKKSLVEENRSASKILASHIYDIYGVEVSDAFLKSSERNIKNYGLEEMLTSCDISYAAYVEDDQEEDQIEKFLNYIPKIAYRRQEERKNPVIGIARKISFTAKKRWYHCDPNILYKEIQGYIENHSIDIVDIENAIYSSNGIMKFREKIEELIEGE